MAGEDWRSVPFFGRKVERNGDREYLIGFMIYEEGSTCSISRERAGLDVGVMGSVLLCLLQRSLDVGGQGKVGQGERVVYERDVC